MEASSIVLPSEISLEEFQKANERVSNKAKCIQHLVQNDRPISKELWKYLTGGFPKVLIELFYLLPYTTEVQVKIKKEIFKHLIITDNFDSVMIDKMFRSVAGCSELTTYMTQIHKQPLK